MVHCPSLSLKTSPLGPLKRKQVTLSTEKKSVCSKSVINDERDKVNIEKEDVLTVSTIKPNKQKYAKKQPTVNMINLRKLESNKKEAIFWKDFLSG